MPLSATGLVPSALPVTGDDPLWRALGADLSGRWPGVVRSVAAAVGGAGAGGAARAADAFDELDEPVRHAVVHHPVFQRWWVALAGLRRSRDEAGLAHALLDVPSFVVVPALAAGVDLGGPMAVLARAGEVRFPGYPRHLVVRPGGGDEVVRLDGAGGDVTVTAEDGTRCTVPAAALAGRAPAPEVVERPLLPTTGIEVDATDRAFRQLFADMNAQEPVAPYPKRDLRPLEVVGPAEMATYGAMVDLVRAAWPEALDELERYVRVVVPFRSEFMIGWASAVLQGAVFLRTAPDDLLFTVERFVHEGAHLRLYAMQRVWRVHDNDHGDLLPSPFRRDPRPVTGVYHAAFVYGRLAEFFTRAEAATGTAAYGDRAREIAPKYHRTVEILRTGARLTDVGEALLDQLDERVAACGLRPEAAVSA